MRLINVGNEANEEETRGYKRKMKHVRLFIHSSTGKNDMNTVKYSKIQKKTIKKCINEVQMK